MQMPTSQYQIELLHAQAPYRPDPTVMFNQLCGARPATLLLESAEIDKKHDFESMWLSIARCVSAPSARPSRYRRKAATAPALLPQQVTVITHPTAAS